MFTVLTKSQTLSQVLHKEQVISFWEQDENTIQKQTENSRTKGRKPRTLKGELLD